MFTTGIFRTKTVYSLKYVSENMLTTVYFCKHLVVFTLIFVNFWFIFVFKS